MNWNAEYEDVPAWVRITGQPKALPQGQMRGGNTATPVRMWKDGKYIIFPSLSEAARYLNLPRSTVSLYMEKYKIEVIEDV